MPGSTTWSHLDHRVVNDLDEVIGLLGLDRFWSYSTKAARPYTEASFRPGDVLLFGPESRGLPQRWIDGRPQRALRIPMRPAARSLNLACAVSIALYEALRQVTMPETASGRA